MCRGERAALKPDCSGERCCCCCWSQVADATGGAVANDVANDDDASGSALALLLLLQVALALELLRRQTIANTFKHLVRMVRATFNFC